jgi:hypothetical protein
MGSMENIQQAIREERRTRESAPLPDLGEMIRTGKSSTVLEKLLYFTDPEAFLLDLDYLIEEGLNQELVHDRPAAQHYLKFFLELSLALYSILPRWNLQNRAVHLEAALTNAQVQATAARVKAAAAALGSTAPLAAQAVLAQQEHEIVARLKAEGAQDPSGEAAALVGNSIDETITHLSAEISCSHLRRMAEMRFSDQTQTEFSNDYAAFLPYALYLGASFATTNPPLVNLAWGAQPEHWDKVAVDLIQQHPGWDSYDLAKLMTLEVVLEQMQFLRPIFLLSDGKMGYVCLQVAPRNHSRADLMIEDALFFYQQLQDRLQGGIPNVVFKLPGTAAGLEAGRALTKKGIGVTITVNFGMFQHLPFIQAIADGAAITSYIVQMNGRLAFPVRDELLGKLSQLEEQGFDEARVRKAAAWAGVVIAKRLHSYIENTPQRERIKSLIASLRFYQGGGYQDLPSPCPDISETVGSGIISVFPNIRRAFDRLEEIELTPHQVEGPVPNQVLEVLEHSEIFKQSYYIEGDELRLKPKNEITLKDEPGVAAWAPVRDTLAEFIKAYETTAGHFQNLKATSEH